MTNFIKTISTITLALTSAVVFANPSAYDIMKKADARDDGTTLSGTIKMVLIDKHGKKRIRVMKSYQKDIDENTEHKSIFFLSPSDVKNTAFLNYDYKNINSKEDDQWMYLPE
jgi:hypothetical protein